MAEGGGIKWIKQWPEVFSFGLLVLGFIISLLLRQESFSYLTILFSGFLAARGYYLKKQKEPIFPFILLIIGFLVGYIIGAVWVSRIMVFFFFILGFCVSYYLHKKKIVTIFKSEIFIK